MCRRLLVLGVLKEGDLETLDKEAQQAVEFPPSQFAEDHHGPNRKRRILTPQGRRLTGKAGTVDR